MKQLASAAEKILWARPTVSMQPLAHAATTAALPTCSGRPYIREASGRMTAASCRMRLKLSHSLHLPPSLPYSGHQSSRSCGMRR